MGKQKRFEFGRGHLETLVLNEFLEPIDDPDVAVIVDMGDVAGVQPTVGIDGRLGCRLVVEVASHYLWSANA